jgi:hypothetical protein
LILPKNFNASNGFVGGMYLIPLFCKEGLGEIFTGLRRLKIPLNPPFKRGKKKLCQFGSVSFMNNQFENW